MKCLKIIIYQMEIIWENKDANFAQLEEQATKWKENKIDVVFLPEMSFTGFSMDINKTRDTAHDSIQKVSRLAKKNGFAVGFGWVKAIADKAENHYTLVGKDGNVISDYIKMHPFSYANENKYFLPGNKLSYYEINGIPMSNFICYDLRFPEIFQIISEKAHVIVIAANWPAQRANHWETLLKARAIENQIYIVAINCVGLIGGIEYQGGSCIINPDGQVLTLLKDKGELKFEICDDVNDYRKKFPIKSDRRNELYRVLNI